MWSKLKILLVGALALPAVALAGDAGMAVSVTGEVQARLGGAGKAVALEPFARVQPGDVLEIPKDGAVQLLFYQSGRRETWPGPSSVRVGDSSSTLVDGGVEPAVEDLGGTVGEGMSDLQVILTRAEKERGGMALVRGSSAEPVGLDEFEQRTVDTAKAEYERLSAATRQPDDIVAELAYAAVLLTYDQRDAAQTVLTTASERCGGCETARLLLEWGRPAEAEAPK